jgi:hypothetical protein
MHMAEVHKTMANAIATNRFLVRKIIICDSLVSDNDSIMTNVPNVYWLHNKFWLCIPIIASVSNPSPKNVMQLFRARFFSSF